MKGDAAADRLVGKWKERHEQLREVQRNPEPRQIRGASPKRTHTRLGLDDLKGLRILHVLSPVSR
jgi:hypothetical protein